MRLFHKVIGRRTQAAGAFTVQPGASDHLCLYQVHVEVSRTPQGGTLHIGARSPGATQFVKIEDRFSITTAGMKTYGPLFLAELRFEPMNFDTDKSFTVIVTSGPVRDRSA